MKEKLESEPATPTAPAISPEVIAQAIQQLPTETLRLLLSQAGMLPTTVGMSPDQLQAILATVGSVNAKQMQQALRKENPYYPERSVFRPRGKYDDQGNQIPAGVAFRRDTYYCNVLIGKAADASADTLCNEEEIELFNRFEVDKEARDGTWFARIVKRGSREILYVDFPRRNTDDRMGLPPCTHILRELLEGPESVNSELLAKQVAELRAQVAQLLAGRAA